jgi:hypothetical protein
MACFRTILGFIVSKEGNTIDPKKIKALVKMHVPKKPQDIQVFNGMTWFYRCFIINFAYVMEPITKLLRKIEVFKWTTECQTTWGDIENQYIQAPILNSPKWELEFHVRTNTSQLAIGQYWPKTQQVK